jgi:hypothetical protein
MRTIFLSSLLFAIHTDQTNACNGHHLLQQHHDLNPTSVVPEDHRSLTGTDSIPFADCGAESPSQMDRIAAGQIMEHFKARRDSGIRNDFQIPVHFHVVRDDEGNFDLTESMLQEYMDRLNSAFSGSQFSFVHQSTERIDNSDYHYIDDQNYWNLAYEYHKGGKSDMNIYFADIQIAGRSVSRF